MICKKKCGSRHPGCSGSQWANNPCPGPPWSRASEDRNKHYWPIMKGTRIESLLFLSSRKWDSLWDKLQTHQTSWSRKWVFVWDQFEDGITFVLILRKVRSFVGSSSLNMVLAWSTKLLRSPLYWTVVALSRVDLIGTFFAFCYLLLSKYEIQIFFSPPHCSPQLSQSPPCDWPAASESPQPQMPFFWNINIFVTFFKILPKYSGTYWLKKLSYHLVWPILISVALVEVFQHQQIHFENITSQ